MSASGSVIKQTSRDNSLGLGNASVLISSQNSLFPLIRMLPRKTRGAHQLFGACCDLFFFVMITAVGEMILYGDPKTTAIL